MITNTVTAVYHKATLVVEDLLMVVVVVQDMRLIRGRTPVESAVQLLLWLWLLLCGSV